MLGTIAWFEITSRLRRVSTYVYFVIFFLMAFLLMNLAGGAFAGGPITFGTGGKANINAPYALHSFMTLFAHFGIIVTGAIVGRAVYQDFENGAYPLFFTKPISKAQYLGGRFIGAFIVMLAIFSSLALGCWLGSLMPWLDHSRIGPNRPAAYFLPYLTSIIPNLVLTGVIFFALAALVRRILPIYVVSIVFLVGYLIANSFIRDIDNHTIAAMIDPFGMTATHFVTEYWPSAERNTRLITLSGPFLWNRVLWLSVALAVGVYAYRRFAFAHLPPSRRKKELAAGSDKPASMPARVELRHDPGAQLATLAGLVRLQLRETIKSVYFIAIMLCAVGFVLATSSQVGKLYGTTTYPVTYEVLEIVHGTFVLFILILVTFFSGELVWRERDARLDQIVDAMPVPSWVNFGGKLGALLGMQIVLMALVGVCGIVIQLIHGYTHLELGLYLKDLFAIKMLDFCYLCVIATLVHVLVDNKYLGHFIMVLWYVVQIALPFLGIEHNLVIYGSTPEYTYSDMNGYGHYLAPIIWFHLYWALVAVALAVVANLFSVRGVERGLRWRLRIARTRLTGASRVALDLSLAATVGVGAFIFYNTNVLNKYRTAKDVRHLAAAYERQYKKFEKAPLPHVTSATYAVDIYPETRRVHVRSSWSIVNQTDKPMDKLYFNAAASLKLASLTLGRGERFTIRDEVSGFYEVTLAQPLQPKETATLAYEADAAAHGFKNNGDGLGGVPVYGNGTFIPSNTLLHLGYEADSELDDDSHRRKEGLPPKEHIFADWNAPDARLHGELSDDWMSFDATVSTNGEQLAIAPGTLVKEWSDGGRRFFQYHMNGPVQDFFVFLSARYKVVKDRWNDVGIEIDYQAGHEYNLARMVEGVKKSLDYFTKHFGPYQFDHVRIIEFPRYATFAQSFPNTIPFSEAIGFIAKVNPKDENDVDYPFYVTAHEVAHQWWGHQVVGAKAQGANLLVESLAQYSALMVMKHDFGEAQMKRFLKYELDNYLRQRVFERKKEAPLDHVETQSYVYYNKASLVMYALQDYLGEVVVNDVLAKFIREHKYEGAPHLLAKDLVDAFRAAAPAKYHHLIGDLFEKIVFFQNRALAATVKRVDDKYEVHLKVSCKKLESDPNGAEKEVALDEWIDVGVLDAKGQPLVLAKQHIDRAEMDFTFTVDSEPARAGIDPLVKLIDRNWQDNTIAVEK
jgi:ABC-2 type transport system permease protein